MKTFPLRLTDEQHEWLHRQAHAEMKSKHQYIMDRVFPLLTKLDKQKLQPTPSKEEWRKINKAQEVLNDGFVANSKKSPSYTEEEKNEIQNKFSADGWLKADKHIKKSKSKEYGYPKSKSLK